MNGLSRIRFAYGHRGGLADNSAQCLKLVNALTFMVKFLAVLLAAFDDSILAYPQSYSFGVRP